MPFSGDLESELHSTFPDLKASEITASEQFSLEPVLTADRMGFHSSGAEGQVIVDRFGEVEKSTFSDSFRQSRNGTS